MDKIAKKILKEALHLSPGERAIVAEKLLTSLDKQVMEMNKLLMEELEHQIDTAERSDIETIYKKAFFNKFEKIPSEAQKEVIELVQFLYDQYIRSYQKESPKKPISESPFVGMWKDRSDLVDSTGWVKQQRRIQWTKR